MKKFIILGACLFSASDASAYNSYSINFLNNSGSPLSFGISTSSTAPTPDSNTGCMPTGTTPQDAQALYPSPAATLIYVYSSPCTGSSVPGPWTYTGASSQYKYDRTINYVWNCTASNACTAVTTTSTPAQTAERSTSSGTVILRKAAPPKAAEVKEWRKGKEKSQR